MRQEVPIYRKDRTKLVHDFERRQEDAIASMESDVNLIRCLGEITIPLWQEWLSGKSDGLRLRGAIGGADLPKNVTYLLAEYCRTKTGHNSGFNDVPGKVSDLHLSDNAAAIMMENAMELFENVSGSIAALNSCIDQEFVRSAYRWAKSVINMASEIRLVQKSSEYLTDADLCRTQTPHKGCCWHHDTHSHIQEMLETLLYEHRDKPQNMRIHDQQGTYPRNSAPLQFSDQVTKYPELYMHTPLGSNAVVQNSRAELLLRPEWNIDENRTRIDNYSLDMWMWWVSTDGTEPPGFPIV